MSKLIPKAHLFVGGFLACFACVVAYHRDYTFALALVLCVAVHVWLGFAACNPSDSRGPYP